MSPEVKAEVVRNATKNAVTTVTQDMGRDGTKVNRAMRRANA
jgi:hypothetical protein